MRTSVRVVAAATAFAMGLALVSSSSGQIPEVSVVVAVGQTATFSVTDFQPRKHVKVWLLETPSFSTGLCFNQSMPQGACGIDVGSWRTDARGRATISFRWPAYFCARGTRTRRCRKKAWRHGAHAVVAVYSADRIDEAEAKVVVR